jgi:hypothetical protein
MTYMTEWLGWKAGKISDDDIIARMYIDPFFKRWFEAKRANLVADREQRRELGETRSTSNSA